MDEMIMCNMKEIAHSDKTNKQRISPQFPSVLQSFFSIYQLIVSVFCKFKNVSN